MVASKGYQHKFVGYLLQQKHKFYINQVEEIENSLYIAVRNRRLETVKLLLEFLSKMDSIDSRRYDAALSLALSSAKSEPPSPAITSLLLDYGAKELDLPA
jgi:ankyrin repeat protein